MSILQNFSIPSGDVQPVQFQIEDDTISLHAAMISVEVFGQTHGVQDGNPPIITKTNGSPGGITLIESPASFTVAFERADTINLLGNYYFEARVVDSLNEFITVTYGIMTVTQTEIRP
jgi:hypothetical protein